MAHTQAVVSRFHGLLAKPYGTASESSGSGVAVAHDSSPFVSAYPYTDQIGFGTKYTNPGTLPGSIRCSGVTFTPNGDTIFLAGSSGAFVFAYPWSTAGFGTKYADPVTAANGVCTGIACRTLASSANHHIAAADSDGGAAVYVNAWRFSKTGAGWGTKFTNPVTKPTGSGLSVAFSPNGLSVMFGHSTSPFITGYPWSDAGFGTKYANPATLPESDCNKVKFSRAGGALAGTHTPTPTNAVTAWAWTSGPAGGFGTKYSDPSYPPAFADVGRGLAFLPAAVIVGTTLSASFDQNVSWVWSDAGGFGTRYTQLPRIPASVASVAANESGSSVFRTLSTAARMSGRKWTGTGTGFGTEYTNPVTLPAGTTNDIAVAP